MLLPDAITGYCRRELRDAVAVREAAVDGVPCDELLGIGSMNFPVRLWIDKSSHAIRKIVMSFRIDPNQFPDPAEIVRQMSEDQRKEMTAVLGRPIELPSAPIQREPL